MKKQHRIQRYSAPERINHWVTALCFLFTALSGLGFLFPSFNWLMWIYGTPQLARILHPFVGVAMFMAFIIMFFRYFKHNLPERSDKIWLKNFFKVLRNEEVSEVGRYNPGQKGVFWAAIITLLLLLASGIVIWRPWFAGSFSIPLIRLALLVHSVAAVSLIIVIMVHVYAAFWIKGSVTAMVEGWVSKRWAKTHHFRWYQAVTRPSETAKKQEKQP